MRRIILAICGTAIATALLIGAKGPLSGAAPPSAILAGEPLDPGAVAADGGAPAPGSGPSAGPSAIAVASLTPTAPTATTTPTAARTTTTPASKTTPTAKATTATTAKSTATTPAGGVSGTFTGAASNNKYGTVQVQITMSNGKMTKVVALQLPNGDSRSQSINSRAAPILAQEALAAQSANIDTVSGATYTSKSYRASLQSALDAARD